MLLRNEQNNIDKAPDFRIGIVGLPGSGKTMLSERLAPLVCLQNADYGVALISGDSVLPNNLSSICSSLNRFVVEHICLVQIFEIKDTQLLDAIIFLDIPIEICQQRCNSRKDHIVGVESFTDLYEEIYRTIDRLCNKYGIISCSINLVQQEYIVNQNLKNQELLRYLFPGEKLVENYHYSCSI